MSTPHDILAIDFNIVKKLHYTKDLTRAYCSTEKNGNWHKLQIETDGNGEDVLHYYDKRLILHYSIDAMAGRIVYTFYDNAAIDIFYNDTQPINIAPKFSMMPNLENLQKIFPAPFFTVEHGLHNDKVQIYNMSGVVVDIQKKESALILDIVAYENGERKIIEKPELNIFNIE